MESRLDVLQQQKEEIVLQSGSAKTSFERSVVEMAQMKQDYAKNVSVLEEKMHSLHKELQRIQTEKNALDVRSKESERRLRSEIDGLRKEYDNLVRKTRETGVSSSKPAASSGSSGTLPRRDSRRKDPKEGLTREELRGEDILRSLHLTESVDSSGDARSPSAKGEIVGSVLFPPDTPTSSGGGRIVSGEIAMYQEQITHLEQQRCMFILFPFFYPFYPFSETRMGMGVALPLLDVLSERLAASTGEVGRLKEIRKEYDTFKKQAQGMASRYKVTLEVLGEKEETIMALEADMEEVKDMFRKQVVGLLEEIDSLKKKNTQA
jgi:hypothetical protein